MTPTDAVGDVVGRLFERLSTSAGGSAYTGP